MRVQHTVILISGFSILLSNNFQDKIKRNALKSKTTAFIELLIVIDKNVIERFEKIFKSDENILLTVELYAENLIRRV